MKTTNEIMQDIQRLSDLNGWGKVWMSVRTLDIGCSYLLIIGDQFQSTGSGIGIASFKLVTLPHCSGVCVSCDASVLPMYRNRGLGTLLNLYRISAARELNYGLLLSTVVSTNTHQLRIMQKNRWTQLMKFMNPNSSNEVILFGIGQQVLMPLEVFFVGIEKVGAGRL